MVLELVDEVTVNRWILEALEDVNTKVLPRDVITATEASSPCLRKAFYDRVKAPMPSPIEFIKLVGEEAHARLLQVLKKHGYEIEVSYKLRIKDFTLAGRVDAVKEDAKDRHIVEFKIVEDLTEKPFESHKLQVQLYMLFTRIPVAYLVYISRKDGRVKVFKVRYSREKAKEAVKRAYMLYKALKENIPPPPERGPWCNTCPYTLMCSKRISRSASRSETQSALHRESIA
jgi:CRISPR-associated protein Cas4